MSALDLFRVVGAAVAGTANRVHLQVRGLGQDGDDEGSEPIDNVHLIQPLGLFARAVVARSLRVIGWRRGDEVAAIGAWNKGIAQDPAVDAGETRVYSVGEPKVCLRVGPVHIELRVNVTGEVRLASDAADYAGKSVARVDDAVDCGRFVTVGGDRDLYWLPPGGGNLDWVAIPNQVAAPVLASDGEAVTAKVAAGAAQVKA
jgi:hypothetical protein